MTRRLRKEFQGKKLFAFDGDGVIYKGDQLAEAGSWKKALKFYNKALNETDDTDLASIAAFKIAQYYLNYGKRDKAKEYLVKIIEGNSKYFYEHFETD